MDIFILSSLSPTVLGRVCPALSNTFARGAFAKVVLPTEKLLAVNIDGGAPTDVYFHEVEDQVSLPEPCQLPKKIYMYIIPFNRRIVLLSLPSPDGCMSNLSDSIKQTVGFPNIFFIRFSCTVLLLYRLHHH